MTIHEPYTGPIGPSMAEFSGDYMSYVEAHLEEDLKQVPDRRQAFEDILWSLVNSAEFLHRS